MTTLLIKYINSIGHRIEIRRSLCCNVFKFKYCQQKCQKLSIWCDHITLLNLYLCFYACRIVLLFWHFKSTFDSVVRYWWSIVSSEDITTNSKRIKRMKTSIVRWLSSQRPPPKKKHKNITLTTSTEPCNKDWIANARAHTHIATHFVCVHKDAMNRSVHNFQQPAHWIIQE